MVAQKSFCGKKNVHMPLQEWDFPGKYFKKLKDVRGLTDWTGPMSEQVDTPIVKVRSDLCCWFFLRNWFSSSKLEDHCITSTWASFGFPN